MTWVGARRGAQQYRGREDREGLDEAKAEDDREPGREERQVDVQELPSGACAERRRSLRQRRVDPGDVGEDQEEGEREFGDDQRQEHAPVIVGEPDRRGGEPAIDQQPVDPALRPEIGQQPLGDQHRSERDRQDEDRGQDALPRAVAPDAESDRQREPDIDEGRRDREPRASSRSCCRGTAPRRSGDSWRASRPPSARTRGRARRGTGR